MKNINLLFQIMIIVSMPLCSMDSSILLTTIFTPAPLLDLHHHTKKEQNYITTIKKAAIPLTCCFFYSVKKNDIWMDIIQNPWTASISLYVILHYSVYFILQKQQQEIDQEIINMMQHVFHLLIIGHGIYNKMITPSHRPQKISIGINSSALETLQLFLLSAYNTWFILFSYYQEHYKNKPLYTYHMDQIDLFEMLQASTHEPDMLPLITIFCDKNNRTFDYKPILNCLEVKLKLINHKLKRVLPG